MHKGPKMNSARRRSCKIARESYRSNLPSRLKMMPSTAGHASLRTPPLRSRAGALTPNELHQEMGYDTRPGGDELQPQAVGGRFDGTGDGDGEGDALPAPDPTNGTGKGNGAAAPA